MRSRHFKKVLVLILLSIALFGCTKSNQFYKDFPYMRGTEVVYEKISFSDALSIFKEKTGTVVLVYNANQYECIYCKCCLPLLNEVALEEKQEKVYYLDIYEDRRDNTKEYQELLALISESVDNLEIRDGKKLLVVPDVYFIKDGKIESHHIATFKDSNEKYITDLTDEVKEELKKVYKDGFDLLK